ncbi:MAG: 6-hydroxymethylpterin diphosphokinase MptE-like protein [Spirochaetia bacterium]
MSIYYSKNFSSLTERVPRARDFLDDTRPGDTTSPGDESVEELEEIAGRGGMPTIRFKGRFLHSKLDPHKEAARIIRRSVDPSADVHVFMGFGYGYHIEEYLRSYPEKIAVVIEKEAKILRSAMKVRDLTHIFSDPRMKLLPAPEHGEIRFALTLYSARKISTVSLEQFIRNDPDYYLSADSIAAEISSRRKVNMATLDRFGKLWVRNLAKNLPILGEAEDAGRIEGLLEGIPVLLLAAGPSLDEVLPHIENLKKRMAVIAVDTAAGALASAGYAPDIMVVVDPQYWNTRHLDPLYRRGSLFRRTCLISESSTHPSVFRIPVGKIFLGGSVFPLGEYLEEAAGEKKKLGAGGSVATTAWDLGALAGAREIYTAGLDLGFPGGRTHYSGGFFEHLLHSISQRFTPYSSRLYSYIMSGDPFFYTNNSGGETLTDRRLSIYRRWFEEQLVRPDSPRTVNLGSEAIAIEGMEHRPFSELMNLPERREEIDDALSSLLRDDEVKKESRVEAVRRRASILVKELELLRTLSRKARETTLSLLEGSKDEGSKNVSIEDLDALDAQIRSSAGKGVTEFIIQPLLEEVLSQMEEAETLEDSLRQSERIYREVMESAEFHINLFKNY